MREQLEHVTPQLLKTFAQGKVDILRRVAAGLNKTQPGHPDLPLIHFTTHEIGRSLVPIAVSTGPGKGRKPVISIPLGEVPQAFLDVIRGSHYKPRFQEDLTVALREVLGAARRASLPEILNRESLVAFRAELETREQSAKTTAKKVLDCKCLGLLFKLDAETMALLTNELRAAKLEAELAPSQRHAAFRAAPLTPLDYARLARSVSEEAYACVGNRQSIHRLFTTAAALAFLSFLPDRIADILKLILGQGVTRDVRGWSSSYFSNKSDVDRSIDLLPDQLTPYLDDLVLLGADPGPQGRDLMRLYRHRVEAEAPLFARTDLHRAYSPGRIFELVKERTGHGPHAARKAMTDYQAEIGGSPRDIMNLLGHRRIATSEKHYAVRAAAIRRQRATEEVGHLRSALDDGPWRIPSGKLIDLSRICGDLDRA
ncbi:hypothetical protein FALB51S_01999 [Frigidibacter albus]